MKNYEELEVWQKAHALTVHLYAATATFPRSEMFGLTSQIRRAAGSIGANLAEGCGRWNEVELARYVQIAMGSASELQNHLRLAADPGFLTESAYCPLAKSIISIRQMLTALLQTLRRTRNTLPTTPANGERRAAKSGVTS
ncbi:MAG: four helix bundle protein [Candidatus Korobacteraceae bacterium]|jgi:four helix bundle protein